MIDLSPSELDILEGILVDWFSGREGVGDLSFAVSSVDSVRASDFDNGSNLKMYTLQGVLSGSLKVSLSSGLVCLKVYQKVSFEREFSSIPARLIEMVYKPSVLEKLAPYLVEYERLLESTLLLFRYRFKGFVKWSIEQVLDDFLTLAQGFVYENGGFPNVGDVVIYLKQVQEGLRADYSDLEFLEFCGLVEQVLLNWELEVEKAVLGVGFIRFTRSEVEIAVSAYLQDCELL